MPKFLFLILFSAILAIYTQASYGVTPHQYNWPDLPGELKTHVISFLDRAEDGINRKNLLEVNKEIKSIIEKKGNFKISPSIRDRPITERLEFFNELLTYNAENIRTLNLENCNLTDDGVPVFSGVSFSNLQELNLRWNNITHVGAMNFSQFICPNLKKLNLRGNSIKNFGVLALYNSNFPELEELNLRETTLGYMGASVLPALKFPNLKKLNLRGNNLGENGPTRTLNRLPFPRLEKLNLRENNLDDESAREISRGSFPNLEELYLTDNNITEIGILALGSVAKILKE